MPTKEEHLEKAIGNEALGLSMPLDTQTSIDWALVMLFYAAVHYVEAYLALSALHLRSHTTRDSYVGRDSKLKKIFQEYQDLKFYGYNARYEVLGFSASDVKNVAAKAVASVRTHIERLIK